MLIELSHIDKIKDLDEILSIRNQPHVINSSFTRTKIQKEAHYKWWSEFNDHAFKLVKDSRIEAVVLFKDIQPDADKSFEWSFYKREDSFKGAGIVACTLALAELTASFQMFSVQGLVRLHDMRSRAFHARMGFKHQSDIKEFVVNDEPAVLFTKFIGNKYK